MFFWNRSESTGFKQYDWDELEHPPWTWYLRHLCLIGAVVGAGIGAAWWLIGQSMAEKLVTALVQPVGLIWLCLGVVVYFCVVQKRHGVAVSCLLCWLLLTIAGNQNFSSWFVSTLESRYSHIDPYEGEAHEYALLLGGGTVTGPNDRAQLNLNGDRLSVVARMYLAGRIKKIICSGSHSIPNDELKTPSEGAVEILQGLGVPADALLQIEGANTYQEIENLKAWSQAQTESGNDPGRIAIISSAWHLPRAQRLARASGVLVDPVPANFLSNKTGLSPHLVVPGAYQVLVTSQVCKEYLAGFAKR